MKKEKTFNRIITVQVSEPLNERLRDMAWKERKSLSALMRELVSCGLKQKGVEIRQARAMNQ
jgi:predicted CopG family antitoxin